MSDARIAKLETQQENDKETLQGVSKKLDEVAADVLAIKLGLANQRGFLAGCMFILLPIWSAITILAGSWWDKLMNGHHG